MFASYVYVLQQRPWVVANCFEKIYSQLHIPQCQIFEGYPSTPPDNLAAIISEVIA